MSCAVLASALVLFAREAAPTKSAAQQSLGAVAPESTRVAIQAEPATIHSLDHFTVDARLTPAESYFGQGPRPRRILDHALVPKHAFDRIKTIAAYNPFAPVDPFAQLLPDDDALSVFTPPPIVKFPGLTDIYSVEPPDMALAVSPNWVAQGVNTDFAIFNRAGVIQPGWPKSFERFFQVPSPGQCDPAPYLFDPRAFYIIPDQRFVLAVLQLDGPIIFRTCAPLSKYWIAVSKTNNPNGEWSIYSFDMKDGTNVADFTQIGYDANGIYFSGNMFNSARSYQYAEIFGASKTRMEAGLSVTAHGFKKLQAAGNVVDTVQPVESLTQPTSIAAKPVEFFINSKNVPNCTILCSGVTVWAFADLLGTPSLSAANVPTTNYATPPNAVQPGHGIINTDDQRINGTPVYQGGLISFGLNTAIRNRASTVAGIFWGQVMPKLSGTAITGGSVFQSGYLSFPGDRSAYYAALVPDSRGNLFMGFGSSSSTSYASAFYVARKSTDAHGTFEPAVQLFQGRNIYQFSRWGDYSAAAIDGNATTSAAWLALEYATATEDWATELGATRFP